MSISRILAVAPLGFVLGLSLATTQSACSESTCTVNPRSPDEPVPALECGSGDLCYRGSCVRACSAGQEGVEVCESDGDCSGSRAQCVDQRCTACDSGTRCVPALDICQPIQTIPLPPEPERPTLDRPRPPRPRDAGVLDSGLVRIRDAGLNQIPNDQPLTHSLFVDISETVVLAGASSEAGGNVQIFSYDVRGNQAGLSWRADIQPPVIEETIDNDADCDLNRLRKPDVAPTPASFGQIRLANFNMTAALPGDLLGVWDEARLAYEIQPSPPQPLLRLSDFDTLDSTFITITGEMVPNLTDRSWPNQETGLHVPFELRLEPNTRQLLSSTLNLGRLPPDIDLLFDRVGTGVVATERIVVRVPGRAHEIVCRQFEGPSADNRVVVRQGLLQRFRSEENAQPGGTYRLIIERSSAERFQVNPPTDRPNVRLFVSARIRHSLQGEIRF